MFLGFLPLGVNILYWSQMEEKGIVVGTIGKSERSVFNRPDKSNKGCDRPKVAIVSTADLKCPEVINDRDRCRYR